MLRKQLLHCQGPRESKNKAGGYKGIVGLLVVVVVVVVVGGGGGGRGKGGGGGGRGHP